MCQSFHGIHSSVCGVPLATVTILALSTGASGYEGVGAECRVSGLVAVKGFAEPVNREGPLLPIVDAPNGLLLAKYLMTTLWMADPDSGHRASWSAIAASGSQVH